LRYANRHSPPDLVLLDIMMPGMDGFEVAKRMREHPTSETIPIIFVTAMTSRTRASRAWTWVRWTSSPSRWTRCAQAPRAQLHALCADARELQADFDDMVGQRQAA
jgi:two-component system sensor histidine kinase/response regulator